MHELLRLLWRSQLGHRRHELLRQHESTQLLELLRPSSLLVHQSCAWWRWRRIYHTLSLLVGLLFLFHLLLKVLLLIGLVLVDHFEQELLEFFLLVLVDTCLCALLLNAVDVGL
jgi:hypothetical protein